MAVLNPNIRIIPPIDGALFQDEVETPAGDVGADDLSSPDEAVRPGPDGASRKSSPSSIPAAASARSRQACHAEAPFRHARRRRWACGALRRRSMPRARGIRHRRCRAAFRRPGARHHGRSRTSSRCQAHRRPRNSQVALEQPMSRDLWRAMIMNLQEARASLNVDGRRSIHRHGWPAVRR